jgi:hypothetical protein
MWWKGQIECDPTGAEKSSARAVDVGIYEFSFRYGQEFARLQSSTIKAAASFSW